MVQQCTTIKPLEYDQKIGFRMSCKNLVLIKIWIIIVLGKGKYYLYLYLVRWGCTFLGQGSKVWYLLLFPSWRKLLFGNEVCPTKFYPVFSSPEQLCCPSLKTAQDLWGNFLFFYLLWGWLEGVSGSGINKFDIYFPFWDLVGDPSYKVLSVLLSLFQ